MNWTCLNILLLAISNSALVFVIYRLRKDLDIMHMHLTCMMGTLLAKEGIMLSMAKDNKDAH